MSIKPGLYQHFKGAFYKVMHVAQHSESEESLVVYRALYGDKGVWARPLSMFTETVERDGKVKPRFAYVNDQTEVTQRIELTVNDDQLAEFQQALSRLEPTLIAADSYISFKLERNAKQLMHFTLSVHWQSIDAALKFDLSSLSAFYKNKYAGFWNLV